MEQLKKEAFEAWAKKHNWLKVNEISTPNGPQHMYLTPSGIITVALYDIKGELFGFGHPAPATPMFSGGQQPPFLQKR